MSIKFNIKRAMLFILAGLALGVGFVYPLGLASLAAGWVFALIFVSAVRWEGASLWEYLLCGLAAFSMAFSWLPYTLRLFGNFPNSVAVGMYALFCVFTALQLVLCGVFFRSFSKTRLKEFNLALPLAWLVADVVMPKMFPWVLAHTQIVWSGFASLAEVTGVNALSVLMLFWAECIYSAVASKRLPRGATQVILILTVIAVSLGHVRVEQLSSQIDKAPSARIGIIQGNISVLGKHDDKQFQENYARYRALTKQAIEQGAELVLWPESVLLEWTPESLTSLRGTNYDPIPGLEVPLLYGTLSARPRSLEEREKLINSMYGSIDEDYRKFLRFERYNTALGLDASGRVIGRYHKKVLMPFGEFIPFARKFPKLREFSPQSGDFDAGTLSEPIVFFLKAKQEVKIAALICYEDLIARLARDAAQRGANLLVNMTNDAWYGDSAAPYQHHLLAAWRAIETRRYLVRVTNSGFTGVIDPLGVTGESLGVFKEGVLISEVRLLESETLYTRTGDLPVYLVCLALLLWVFIGYLKGRIA